MSWLLPSKRFLFLVCFLLRSGDFLLAASPENSGFLSPVALISSKNGKTLFVACATSNRVLFFDTSSRKVTSTVILPDSPSGLALSENGSQLFVTCGSPDSTVCIIDVAKKQTLETLSVGHTSMAPVLSADGKLLFVCNRFDNNVSLLDLGSRKETGRIAVQREPVTADITKDGAFLLVANHLHKTRSDGIYAAAVVSVIEIQDGEVAKELPMPSGSGSLKDLRVSPDGKYAVVTHVLSRFNRTATSVHRGWMNINAMTIIDLARMDVYNTVLLDDLDKGAANPWGAAWLDNKTVIVTHAGTHEVSVIDFDLVLKQLPNLATKTNNPADGIRLALARAEASDEIPFLSLSHPRIQLPKTDLGPRSVAVIGRTAYVANYFSDTLTRIDFSATPPKVESIPLAAPHEMSQTRKGEFYFHDATICDQGWQSCASCHPDARTDGVNWDLLNDGTGNPKNTKSLLLAHKTPPSMSLGIRENAEFAVRSGIRNILFTSQPEAVAASIDEYLKSMKPVPSPHLVKGKFSPAAERGLGVFKRAGCVDCHPSGLFTSLGQYDIGTRGPFDKSTDRFDTPTLIEVWRTAPYLHDGSAATVRDVLTTRNPDDQHGKTSNLSAIEIDDLCEYVLSL